MKTRVVASLFLGALVLPVAASAQVRDGVPIERLTPPSMTLVRATVPIDLERPVELAFGRGSQATILVGVFVADDAERATRMLEHLRETTSGELGTVTGVGSVAMGDRAFVAFVRDNVFAVVRSVDGSDVTAIATHVDRAILASPRARRVRPSVARFVLPSVQSGAALPIGIEGDVLEAYFDVTGDAYVRRTASGWSLVRSGGGSFAVDAITVDSRLRMSRAITR
jgi:hypothetical protein